MQDSVLYNTVLVGVALFSVGECYGYYEVPSTVDNMSYSTK
jgi:hypothetical protein